MRFVASPRRATRAATFAASIASFGIAERARVHVGRSAGQRRERGAAVQQSVGRLVERAVAREHRDDVEAVVRGGVREPGRRDRGARSPPPRRRGAAASSLRIMTRLRAVTDDAVAFTRSSTRIETRVPGRRPYHPHVVPTACAGSRRARRDEIVGVPRRARASSNGAEAVAREKRASFRDEEYWGRPVPGFGDPAGTRAARRARARRARREPHRPGVHRRPLGRLPVRVAAPHRLREPARVGARRRRAAAARRVRRGRGALRAAREQAHAGRARRVPAVPRARARQLLDARARRSSRSGRSGTRRRGRRCAPRARGVELPARRPRFAHGVEVPCGGVDDRRRVPSEPAEHVHRPAHAGDARRGVRSRARQLSQATSSPTA